MNSLGALEGLTNWCYLLRHIGVALKIIDQVKHDLVIKHRLEEPRYGNVGEEGLLTSPSKGASLSIRQGKAIIATAAATGCSGIIGSGSESGFLTATGLTDSPGTAGSKGDGDSSITIIGVSTSIAWATSSSSIRTKVSDNKGGVYLETTMGIDKTSVRGAHKEVAPTHSLRRMVYKINN